MQLPAGVKMTPMLKQYAEWKDRYPDCLLLFRMGDFFEMFFDDAEKASSVLGIALTARDPERAIPMAGVPHHALESYVARLMRAGFKAAVCDQVTEPDGRTIVERRVVRVITPGTYTPQDEEGDGRLAAFVRDGRNASLALLEPSVGRLRAGTFPLAEAVSLAVSFRPKEMLVPSGTEADAASIFVPELPELSGGRAITGVPRDDFSVFHGARMLCDRWEISSLRAMGVDDSDPAVGAAAAALRYLDSAHFADGAHVRELSPLTEDGCLVISRAAQADLELVESDHSLYSILNRCKTQAGRRLLRDWLQRPSVQIDEISHRLDCVEHIFSDHSLLTAFASHLSRFSDIERALGRICLRASNPRDLGVVRDALASFPAIAQAASDCGCPGIASIFDGLPDVSELSGTLSSALADDLPRSVSNGGVIRCGFDSDLDDARDAIDNAEEHIKIFEQEERARTGIKLKVGANKVFGYYIEVAKSAADGVPDDYVRRQTVSNGERFVNERLKEIERRIFRAEREIGEREETIYSELVAKTLVEIASCQALSHAVARLDVLRSLAEAARDNGYVRPIVDGSRSFSVKGARHPVVERVLRGEAFTPNDIELDPDSGACVAMVTGPNMAGKSTYLRTAALIAIMAHMGSFVPAESARIGTVDRVFTRIGAHDELARGRSTFMVEMIETADILRNATHRSLVILDEVGRGTSTYDGMSIAWAVVEFLCLHIQGRLRALFATHYHELTSLALPMLKNLSIAAEETPDGVRFLHHIKDGPADRSYGIDVARLAGVPSIAVNRAREILKRFEQEHEGSKSSIASMSEKYAQKEIFFDQEREAVIERAATCNIDMMTPIDALTFLASIRKECRKIMGI